MPEKERTERGEEEIIWLNHFDLLPGDESVQTSYNAVTSGVGGGLTGLVITSTSTGDNADGGGNKVVHMAVAVPPTYFVTGVRIGYELTSANSYISQIRLAQIEDPPATAAVRLDDGTAQTDPGPIHVDSSSARIDPAEGALILSLRVNFGDIADRIVVRSLGLHLVRK